MSSKNRAFLYDANLSRNTNTAPKNVRHPRSKNSNAPALSRRPARRLARPRHIIHLRPSALHKSDGFARFLGTLRRLLAAPRQTAGRLPKKHQFREARVQSRRPGTCNGITQNGKICARAPGSARTPNLAAARAAGGHLTTGAGPSGHLCGDAGLGAEPRLGALCDFSSHRARSPHVCGFCFRMKRFLS